MVKYRAMTNEWKLTARTVRAVSDALLGVVRRFGDAGRIRFRGRRLGQEAVINAAVWYFSDLDGGEQERILRQYLPRLEAYLLLDSTDQGEGAGFIAPNEAEYRPPGKREDKPPRRRKA